MANYVEVAQIGKTYRSTGGAITALDNFSLAIREGEFISVVGPSGCGKSTLLRCIAGLENISSGTISIKGRPIDGPPEALGIVFQRDTLVDWRTALGNVLLVAEFRKRDRTQAKCRACELLALFGLSEFVDKYPWELSGGMRQRVAICRALLDDPELLLMDEPFGALDAITRDQLNVELQRIWHDRKKTVMFITHSIAEAVFLSDRIAVMSRAPGTVVDVIDIDLPRPRKLTVRETPEFSRLMARLRDIFMSLGILRDE
jgi:NitT/TauT family transport system ATP-binding protein